MQCDGGRPICSSCIAKKRVDCFYDTTSDQRRTSALKQKIDELARESSALKEIIGTICSTGDRDTAVETASKLSLNGFQGIEAVASLLRSQHVESGLGVVTTADAGRAWPPGVSMPPVTGFMHLAIGPGSMPHTPAQSGWEVESSPESVDNKQWVFQDKSLEVSLRCYFQPLSNSVH